MARSLRCLELDVEGADDDPLPQHAITLIQSNELVIIHSGGAPTPDWCSNLLVSPLGSLCHGALVVSSQSDVLAVIDPATSLRALRFRCGGALLQERLDDLGPLPPRLKYIGWDCCPRWTVLSTLVYVIEKRDDKNIVVDTLARPETDDWMAQGVLHFMGEPWTP